MCVSATSLRWFGRVWKGKDTNPKTANTAGEKIKIWGFGDILMDRVVAASQRRVGKWPSKREFHRSYGGSRGPCNESSLWWSHGNMTPHRPLWFSLMKMVEGIEDVFSAFWFFYSGRKKRVENPSLHSMYGLKIKHDGSTWSWMNYKIPSSNVSRWCRRQH